MKQTEYQHFPSDLRARNTIKCTKLKKCLVAFICSPVSYALTSLKNQEGANKQSVATFIEVSQDGGYVGIGWEGNSQIYCYFG